MSIDHDNTSNKCECVLCDMRQGIFDVLLKHKQAVEFMEDDGTKVVRVEDTVVFYEALSIIVAEALSSQRDPGIMRDFVAAVELYMRDIVEDDEGYNMHLHEVEEDDEIVEEPASATKH